MSFGTKGNSIFQFLTPILLPKIIYINQVSYTKDYRFEDIYYFNKLLNFKL